MNAAGAIRQSMGFNRKKVLVIDDDPVICKFMEHVISDVGYEVRYVQDGLSALDVLHFYHPHIIFLDIVLPDMDGKHLCRTIRDRNDLKSVYITVFSGILLEEQMDLLQLGADALLAKGPMSQMEENVRQVLMDPEGVSARCRTGEIIGTENIYPRKMTAELLSSNRHFNLVLENMRQGILELSPDGRILFANKAAAVFLRKSHGELLAVPFISLINENERPRVAALLKPQNAETISIPDDDPLGLHDRLFSMEILSYTSQRGHITLIMTDVTRIRRESDARKQGEERLWRIINHFSDAVILADAEGVVQMVNPAAEKLFGRNADDFVGSSFGFPLLAGEASELDILSSDGTLKVGEMRTVDILWEGEKAYLAAIRDITERKQMEEDLRRANERILEQQEKLIEEERLKVLLQMSGATAHELNQPLSVLLGNIDLMRAAEGDPKEVALCINEIEKAGRRIADTIKKIQNIRHYETKPYGSGSRIVNIEQKLHVLSIEDSDEEKKKLKREIRTAHRKISEMATLDELTGLYNRRYFMEALERERSRAERHGKALSLCMMDLDFFKRVNDKLGHRAGDLVLADVGRIIREWSRQSDLPCRYGGEEFAVILPETHLEGARIACERLRLLVAENQVPWRTGPIQITVSIGVAQNRKNVKDSIRKLIDRADEALYRAKETGRNRVEVRNGG